MRDAIGWSVQPRGCVICFGTVLVISVLLLGFLLGLRHAMEGDHVAAVASLVARQQSFGRTLLHGVAWGLGHAATLFIACSAVLFLDLLAPARLAVLFEALVGLMLVALGADVLAKLRRERIHAHVHRHGGGAPHLHAHAHLSDGPHDPLHHDHEHRAGFPLRSLLVGMVHGLAGSAALILLTLERTESPFSGLAYVVLFGIGATVGMVLLSAAIAVPLRWSAGSFAWIHRTLQAVVSVVTIGLGVLLLWENLGAATSHVP